MHRVFYIDEVLRMAFSSFANDMHDAISDARCQENCRALLNLALTCSAFKEPSLDVLWRALFSPGFLFRLLPADALDFRDGKLSLARHLTRSDWDRVRFYAPRVRSVHMDCPDPRSHTGDGHDDLPSSFHHSFFQAIMHAYNASNIGPLLPNLRSLMLTPAQLSDINCLSIFLSPTLERLHLTPDFIDRYDDLSEAVVVVCDLVTQSTSRLSISRLNIPYTTGLSYPEPHPDITTSYTIMLRCLQALVELTISGALLKHPTTWDALAQLLNLERLSVEGQCDPQAPPAAVSAFPKLHKLSASCLALLNLLDKLPQGRLSSIDMSQAMDEDPPHAVLAVQALDRKCPGLLDYSSSCYEYFDHPLLPSLPLFLEPILQNCQGLVRLNLTLSTAFPETSIVNPSNKDYQTICQSLPDLEAFSIHVTYVEVNGTEIPPRATLQGSLQAFATFCPKLRELCLGLNLSWDARVSKPSKIFTSLVLLDLSSTKLKAELGDSPLMEVREGDSMVWGYLFAIKNQARVHIGERGVGSAGV